MSVYPRAYLRSYSLIFTTRYVLPVLRKTSYLHTVGHNYGGMSILLQRVTSLRRRVQAIAAAASHWLSRFLD